MSRQRWMDQTIETARTADIRMPWSRTARRDEAQTTEAPLKAQAKG
ncbi:MAG: hypothetical protein AAFY65_03575 [Pseudomonadota bacterium]